MPVQIRKAHLLGPGVTGLDLAGNKPGVLSCILTHAWDGPSRHAATLGSFLLDDFKSFSCVRPQVSRRGWCAVQRWPRPLHRHRAAQPAGQTALVVWPRMHMRCCPCFSPCRRASLCFPACCAASCNRCIDPLLVFRCHQCQHVPLCRHPST